MTARIVVTCDGRLPTGMRCRAALTTRARGRYDAYGEARGAGWRIGISEQPVDLCPSCSRRDKP